MSDRRRAASMWLPPIAVMAVIFALSSIPSADVDRGFLDVALRKLAHFAEYGLLAGLLLRALQPRLGFPAALRAAFALSVAYAIGDEIHQGFVDGRIASPFDVLIDAAGAATALALLARRRAASPR